MSTEAGGISRGDQGQLHFTEKEIEVWEVVGSDLPDHILITDGAGEPSPLLFNHNTLLKHAQGQFVPVSYLRDVL